MARTIGNEGDQIAIVRHALRLIRRQLFQQLTNGFHHLDIFTFVMTADIVSFARFAAGRHQIQRSGVIFHVQPIADLLSIAIHRQRLARQRVKDRQRDQLLGKVIRAVVI